MKVYYAHCIALYNTKQEERDVQILTSLGLEVLNPNTVETQERCNKEMKGLDGDAYKAAFDNIFHGYIDECPVFAFRALPDGRIPGGVAMELNYAQSKIKLIIELPCNTVARSMSKDDTREYLRDVGYR
jgi:hypothetical protein